MNCENMSRMENKKEYRSNLECLDTHLSKFFKPDEIFVIHEILPQDIHIDIYFIKPTNRNYNLLITSGASLYEMDVPTDVLDRNNKLFAELMVLIPKEMEFSDLVNYNDRNGWVLSMLKETARFPHDNSTWLFEGLSLQTDINFEPYSRKTNFVGCVIIPSATLDENFTEFYCENHRIKIHSLFPLYKNELEYKISNNYEKFFDLVINTKSTELIDCKRKNMLTQKRSWSLFK